MGHFRDTLIILEEGNLPHPWCPWCDILAPCKALNRRQVTTAQCDKEEERNRQLLKEEEMQEKAERYFQAYVRPLTAVTSFKCLGRVLTALDDDWT